MGAPIGHWTSEERAWAAECFRAGDSIGEIAEVSDRQFVDVALTLGVYGYVEKGGRWTQCAPSGALRPSRWIGGMLREVARYRCAHGEEPILLAIEARVSRSRMHWCCKGLVKRRPRLPDALRAMAEAA